MQNMISVSKRKNKFLQNAIGHCPRGQKKSEISFVKKLRNNGSIETAMK
jgi:hypothetical protein